MTSIRKAQRGFSLVTAIFLLVVVAGLGALMATFFAAQQQSSAIDALGSRAYQAARAGAEWGIFQITQSGVTTDAAAFTNACRSGGTLPQPSLAGSKLSPFSLAVSCSASSAVEGTSSVWMYELSSTASGIDGATPGSAYYAERQIQFAVWSKGASQVAVWK